MRHAVLPSLLLLCALGAHAATAPAASVAVPVREVEGIREYKLPNGLQVLLIPDASKPTVTVNVTYRVGSRMESYGETGMAHLLEHLMFKGTKTMANVGAELSKRGMSFNGSTTADRTNYFETFPADPVQLAWVLKTEAGRMTGANVARKDLDSEMTVVRNEMESGENSAVEILIQKTQAAAYQWHHYGKSTIGARSDVENVDIPRLQAFYRKYYQPDNATLIVAGAFDPKRALAEIAADFAPLPRPSRVIAPTYTLEPVQDGEREVTLRRVGGQQALFASYHIPALADPGYAAFEVIVSALTDTPSGRLHKRLVEKGLATEAFGWASRNAEPGLLNLGLVMKKDDALETTQKVFVDTIEGLAAEPVTPEELRRAQRQWDKDFDKILADPQTLCVTLSEAIAAGDWRLLFALRDRVQHLELDEVNAAARTWIKPSNRTLGRFVPTEAPDRSPLAPRVDAQAALKDFHPRPAVAEGEVFDASPANIESRTRRFVLPSGLKVALLPKKSRGATVDVALRLHFGTLDSLRGRRTAAAQVAQLIGAGTRTKTRAQISDAFDALKTDWQVQGSAVSGASATLSTRRETLDGALALLAEVLREPTFPQSEFDQRLRQEIGALEHAADDPEAIAGLALARALQSYPADDVRYVPSIPESLDLLGKLKRDEVADFHKTYWSASHGELAIVGDFDPAQVQAEVTRLFGDWTSAQPYARVPQPPSMVAGLRLVAPVKDKSNALAAGALPLALSDTDADAPALALAAHVLGAGGFDSRLLTRLRQKDGLSYGAGADLSASAFEPSGRLGFYAIFAPVNRARVEQGFEEELDRFVRDGITPEELASARQAMLAARADWRASDAAVARSWAGKLERERTFQWEIEQDAKLRALTLAQVNAAIRKWVVPARIDWSLAGDFGAAK